MSRVEYSRPKVGPVVFREGERRDVGNEGVGLVDVEVAGVDLVQSETTVQVRQRRLRGLDCAVVGEIDHELVLVRVAEEQVGDDVRRVPISTIW
jgi:hypothetical protein